MGAANSRYEPSPVGDQTFDNTNSKIVGLIFQLYNLVEFLLKDCNRSINVVIPSMAHHPSMHHPSMLLPLDWCHPSPLFCHTGVMHYITSSYRWQISISVITTTLVNRVSSLQTIEQHSNNIYCKHTQIEDMQKDWHNI